MTEDTQSQVLWILARFVKTESLDNLGIDEDYVAKYSINSLDFVRIIFETEKTFRIEVPDEKLMVEEFNTIRKIQDFVEQRRG